ncbi:phage protease [Azospirillum halopraeferens]|uniref:phage protease n=1 Tax=Azospirillum halopraeferens TaxID=34010 RepID=UPI0006862EFB|nr:phage protease [Azospirillum halopraeferens]
MTAPAPDHHCAADRAERRALCFALPAGGAAPEWIMLLPAGGVVSGIDGRRWTLSDPARVVDAFRDRGLDLVVDWEHGSETRALAGERTPAAGWIQELELRDGAVWGRVTWTEAGRADIESGAYRYISPSFDFVRSTKEIARLTSVGLVHAPNLPALPALNREELMDLKALCRELGLAETATMDEVLAAVRRTKSDLATATNRAETPDIARFVPRADYDTAVARATNAEKALADVEAATLKADVDALIERGKAEGKISPATEDFYRAQCRDRAGVDRFRDFLKAAPKVLDPSPSIPGKPPAGDGTLSDDDRAVCRQMGFTEDDWRKHREGR